VTKPKTAVKPLTVETKVHAVTTDVKTAKPQVKHKTTAETEKAAPSSKLAAAALALQKLVLARKGAKKV
jgi:hypothetical protein